MYIPSYQNSNNSDEDFLITITTFLEYVPKSWSLPHKGPELYLIDLMAFSEMSDLGQGEKSGCHLP